MSGPLDRWLSKLEVIRDRNAVGNEVDISLEKMGTSRAEMLADFGGLVAFRGWLAGRANCGDRPRSRSAADNILKLSQGARRWRGIGEMGCHSWPVRSVTDRRPSRVFLFPERGAAMNPLARRMAKLEGAAKPGANQIAIIIRRVIGTDGDEVVRAVSGDQVVDHRTDEDERAFIEWSKAEALVGTVRRPCRMILLSEGGRR